MNKITENNKLIAEFMDKLADFDESSNMILLKDKAIWTLCKFDSSWDWLMPVVEKIVSLETSIHSVGCYIQENIKDNLTQGIGVAYGTVVEFIKWYNEQK